MDWLDIESDRRLTAVVFITPASRAVNCNKVKPDASSVRVPAVFEPESCGGLLPRKILNSDAAPHEFSRYC